MRSIIKKFNQLFIDILLIIFYVFIIGLARIVYIFTEKKQQSSSYWKNPNAKPLDFYSPY